MTHVKACQVLLWKAAVLASWLHVRLFVKTSPVPLIPVCHHPLTPPEHKCQYQPSASNLVVSRCSCCLAGRAYPLGEIPDEHVVRVKDEVRQLKTMVLFSRADSVLM